MHTHTHTYTHTTHYLLDGLLEPVFESSDVLWIGVLGTEQHPRTEILVLK